MPKVDAIEVLRQIRADTGLHDVPVVILTSSKEDRDLLESYRLGTNAYVVKPVDFRAFTEAVKELGLFWAVINQPPAWPRRKSADQRGKPVCRNPKREC